MISDIVVSVNIYLQFSAFIKVTIRFNWYLVNRSRNKLKNVIFLKIGDMGKTELPKIIFSHNWIKVTDLILFLPHITSTYFGEIPPLQHLLYLQPNQKGAAVAT